MTLWTVLKPDIIKLRRVDLMLWYQVSGPEAAAQEVLGNGVAEGDRRTTGFRAKDDHVCEVGPDLRGCIFAEETAGWEDGFYGPDGEGRGIERDVAGIIL